MMTTLLAGCHCAPPWATPDCATPSIGVYPRDAEGNALEADHIKVYQDDVLTWDLDCAVEHCPHFNVPVDEPGTYRIEVRIGDQTQTEAYEARSVPEQTCCGDYYGDVFLIFDLPTPDPSGCEALDVATCAASEVCAVISGWDTSIDATGGLCVDSSGDPIGYGCHSSELDCPESISYAQPPEGGTCVVFGGCVPAGWGPCDGDPVVNECSTL